MFGVKADIKERLMRTLLLEGRVGYLDSYSYYKTPEIINVKQNKFTEYSP